MSITGADDQTPISTSSIPLVSSRRYISNVLWTWLGVAIGIAGGLFVTPYVVRKIGVDQFSMWTLVLSLVEYYWLIDIGLRSASLKLSAEYYALGQHDELDRLVNTGLVYSMGAGAILASLTVLGAPYAGRLFHITDPVFPQLIRVVGVSWALGLVFNIFGACIEGFQRFDIFGRIWVSTTILRIVAIVLILALGFGVFEMGLVLLASQTLVYLLNFYYYRRLAPQARINLSLATFSKFKEMARYGVHTLRVIVSDRLLRQAVPVMIPYYLPLRDLAFYALPMRILDYAMDGVGRIGNVTTPTATELLAKDRREQLVELCVYANRYSLAIFLPIPIFLLIYGNELYTIWMGADIASHSAYLLPAFLLGHAIVASQMNSVSVLFGIGRHQAYSRFLLGEALLTVLGMAFVLPRFGLLGAAWLANGLMALNRGLITFFLACKELKMSVWAFALRVYARPCLVGAVTYLGLMALKHQGLRGQNVREILAAAFAMAVPYLTASYLLCIAQEHRAQVTRKVRALRLRTSHWTN
jgi:O-antigen/teichoic acid export membrane protein